MSDLGSPKSKHAPPVRVWVDGCFDMMHYGHANALRQARALGDVLVVGIHTDEEITKFKGPPVMTLDERATVLRACKWVDEVVLGAPYCTELSMLVNHNIDFCVHGEDLTFDEDGNDSYQAVKDAGKFRLIKRTEGVSTTDIVGRILLLSTEHLRAREGHEEPGEDVRAVTSPFTRISKFVATSRKIVQFSEGKLPKPTDRIVYVDGSFDLYHAGHAEFFRMAKEMGDYLLVGIYSDEIINKSKGSNFPINNLHERVLNVLSCRYVDEVIMDAPVVVTPELIRMMHISKVVHGIVHDVQKFEGVGDPYEVPKKMDIFEVIDSPYRYLSTDGVISRILENYRLYSARNRKKESKEVANTERMSRLGVKVEAPDEV